LKNEKNHDDEFYVKAEFFSPVAPTANPPHHLGLEPFTIKGQEFRFDAFHGTVPADYAWALDAGAVLLSASPPLIACVTARNRCALFE
jgi:hypothetical protein